MMNGTPHLTSTATCTNTNLQSLPHTVVSSADEDDLALKLQRLTTGPYARVEYEHDGWWISNPTISENPQLSLYYIPNHILCQMSDMPLLMEVFKKNSNYPPQQDPESIQCIAKHTIKLIDNAMSLRNAAKKISWLERNKYPTHKPRKYWPPSFFIHDPVPKPDITCMQCRKQPFSSQNVAPFNINKAAWRVFHISEREVQYRVRTPWPTDSDQFFLCPNCGNTDEADSDTCYPYTIMWIVEDKPMYQPHS